MRVEVDFLSNLSLLICPFENNCCLPRIDFLCRIPECKNCSNYNEKLKKIKVRSLY